MGRRTDIPVWDGPDEVRTRHEATDAGMRHAGDKPERTCSDANGVRERPTAPNANGSPRPLTETNSLSRIRRISVTKLPGTHDDDG